MTDGKGFAENATAFDAPLSVQGVLQPDGRLLIPAAVRDAAGIARGDKVMLRVREGRIEVTSIRSEWKKLNGMFAHLKKPGESVVEEFLAERRALWGEEE